MTNFEHFSRISKNNIYFKNNYFFMCEINDTREFPLLQTVISLFTNVVIKNHYIPNIRMYNQ